MRSSPVSVVDPAELPPAELETLQTAAHIAASSGSLDLQALPNAVREQLLFALAAYARGESVAAIAAGKPLTTNEAAKLLGMSRTHLIRLCDEGLVASFHVGSALRVSSDEVMRILVERGRARSQAREAAATADARRRSRAAKAAGLI